MGQIIKKELYEKTRGIDLCALIVDEEGQFWNVKFYGQYTHQGIVVTVAVNNYVIEQFAVDLDREVRKKFKEWCRNFVRGNIKDESNH